MYEGGTGGGEGTGGSGEGARAEEEEAKNKAYLLGKEYVPEGRSKCSGDFAMASEMTGALEKASTLSATIGVGDTRLPPPADSFAATTGGIVGTKEAQPIMN